MRKRILAMNLIIMLLVFATLPCKAFAEEGGYSTFDVGSYIYTMDGVEKIMDVAPFVENGRTYVPVRYLAYALGIPESGIKWTAENGQLILENESFLSAQSGQAGILNDRQLILLLENNLLNINSYYGPLYYSPVTMDAPPIIRDGRVFLPARYIAEEFGGTVTWNQEQQSVVIFQNNTDKISQEQPSYTKQEKTTISFPDGGSYTGEVLNGLPHGKGRLSAANGITVEGDFANGYPDGNVVIDFGNGGSYIGTFHNNSGQGTTVFPNGDKLTGSFVGGVCNGYGEYTWPSGDIYKGNFLNNKFNGEGTMYYNNGTIAKGLWENGQLTRWLTSDSEIQPTTPPASRVPITSDPDDTIYYPTIKSSGVVESKIKGDFEGWDGDTIFILLNGQIWQQDSYSYTYHYSYMPDVLIYPSGGRYKMHVEGVDKDIYVKRLK